MTDLFATVGAGGQHIRLPDADMLYFPAFWAPAEADHYRQQLEEGIDWQQGHVTVYGKTYQEPRLSAWYGDAGCAYTYSGLYHTPLPWTPLLLAIRARVEACAEGATFNSVLANRYRDGADGVAWHSDDEKELGPAPVIASVTVGQPRPFQMRHRGDTRLQYSLLLPHGSLLLMRGKTQRYWQHRIPKSSAACRPRINLTFRRCAVDVP